MLRIIEAVADEELVRYLPAAVINLHVDLPPRGLREQRAELQAGGFARFEQREQVAHRDAGINDILANDYMPVPDVRI